MRPPADRYLEKRGEIWYYVRRPPKAIAHLDPRRVVNRTLRTRCLETARERRDLLVKEDEARWRKLAPFGKARTYVRQDGPDDLASARARAELAGHVYRPLDEQLASADTRDLVGRLTTLRGREGDARLAAAILGLVPPPRHTVTEALHIYITQIATHEYKRKSDEQKKTWLAARKRAVARFREVCGDVTMEDLSREHALRFHAFWRGRIAPEHNGSSSDGSVKEYRPNTANKELGVLRKLYRLYWAHHGQEKRDNPFRLLKFADSYEPDTPTFPDEWVRECILAPHALDHLNREARLVVYTLIETGCRPSEIVNLTRENIRLNADVPHIRIRGSRTRELKTPASKREIPLVGVALHAMRQAPDGFPRYRDKGTHLSNTLMKSFRSRDLLPTPEHRIYSFRHSFEKRMLEAGLDYGLRCTLMGHHNSRPEYGDGGSLAFRRSQLLKIVHPCKAVLVPVTR